MKCEMIGGPKDGAVGEVSEPLPPALMFPVYEAYIDFVLANVPLHTLRDTLLYVHVGDGVYKYEGRRYG